jgi:hypothetical protein
MTVPLWWLPLAFVLGALCGMVVMALMRMAASCGGEAALAKGE